MWVRLTDLAGKELINLKDGQRLGRLGECDLEVDEASGTLAAVVVPIRRGGKSAAPARIPWASVRRVGPEVLIVDMDLPELPRRTGRF
jgi:YlmC/YmxH family sporulation protein